MTRQLLLLIGSFLCSWSIYGQTANSIQDGPWNDINTWDTGVIPTSSNTTAIVINNSVNVPNSFSVTVDQVSVGINATVTIDAGGTLTVADDGSAASDLDFYNDGFDYGFLTVNGTLINNNNATITGTDGTNAVFNSGAIYRHLYTTTEGIIPIASWDINSTIQIQGYTASITATAAGNWNQSFGNFTFNCSSLGSGAVQLSGLLTDVQNDLTVSATGTTGSLRFSNTENPTVAIGRDFFISGTSRTLFGAGTTTTINVSRDFIFTSTNSTGTNFGTTGGTTVNVGRDFSMNASGGKLNFASSGNATLNVTGNFTLTAGTVVFGSAGAATGTLNLAGNLTNQGTLNELSSSTTAGNINFISSAVHTFINSGSITNSINISVDVLSTLDLGTSVITGSGTFTLNGTLRLGSLDAGGALQTGTTAGNVRVSGTRVYASNSSIVYNGSGAQFIGNGFPSGSDVNLTINNSSGVTLSSSLAIVALRVLTLTSGNISIGAQTLTINGSVTGAGGIVGGATSNLTIGGTGNFGTLTFSGTNQLLNFTLNRTSSGLVTLGGDLTIVGTFTQTDGDLDLNGHSFTLSGAFARTTGDLLVNSASSLTVNGSGALPSDVGLSGTTLGTLTMNRAATTLTTSATLDITNLNLTSGIFGNGTGIGITAGGTITRHAAGTMTNSPNNTVIAYNVTYNNSSAATTGPELPSNTTALANLTKSGSGLVTLNSSITVNGILTLSSGTFNAGSNTIDLKGNMVTNGSSTLTSSTIIFSGTTSLSGSANPVFGNITVTGSLTPTSNFQINGNLVNNGTLNAGSATTTFGGTTTISGSSTSSFNNIIVSSTLTAPTGTMNVAGNFTNNGTFNHHNGSITFNGTTSILGSAATSLYGVNITGTLTAPSTSLGIAGNWATSGTFNHNGGKVSLNGTVTPQSITGTVSVNDVDVFNDTGVNNNGTMNLSGALTLADAAALFDADGAGSGVLTVKSTAVDAGGRIAALPTPGNFTGLVTVERFINGPDSWRYLSMPLTNGNVGTWKANFPVTGNFSDPSPVGVNGVVSSSAPSIYYWDSPTQAYVAVGSGGSTASTSLSNLTGYSAYTYISSDFTISTRGNIRTGNVSISSLSTSGYNLVANPYPSPVDWDNMNRTGLNSTISIRVSNNVFASYVAGGLATNAPFVGWTGEVATGQSFWIQSTGATSLNLTESAKTSNAYQFLRQSEPRNYVRVVLSSDKQRDEAVVWFNENATAGFDDAYDAKKMRNGYFTPNQVKNSYLNLSTYLGDTTLEYSINSISKLKCNNKVGMKVTDVAPGDYTLSFENLETMDLAYQVILVDHFTKVEKQVDSNLRYSFTVTTDKSTFGNSRFELRFLLAGSTWINSVQPPKTFITDPCDLKQLGVSIDTQAGATYQFLKDGKPLTDVIVGSGSAVMASIAKDQLALGNNALSLQVAAQSGCDSYVFDNAIAYDYQVYSPVTITKDGLTLKSNSPDGNQWFKNGVAIDGATGSQFDVQESAIYSVSVSKGGCTLSSEMNVDLTTDVIQVFPVPTDGKVNLILPQHVNASLVSLSLYDVRGVNILEMQSSQAFISNEIKTLDLSNLDRGVYLLQIKADKVYAVKVVKK